MTKMTRTKAVGGAEEASRPHLLLLALYGPQPRKSQKNGARAAYQRSCRSSKRHRLRACHHDIRAALHALRPAALVARRLWRLAPLSLLLALDHFHGYRHPPHACPSLSPPHPLEYHPRDIARRFLLGGSMFQEAEKQAACPVCGRSLRRRLRQRQRRRLRPATFERTCRVVFALRSQFA